MHRIPRFFFPARNVSISTGGEDITRRRVLDTNLPIKSNIYKIIVIKNADVDQICFCLLPYCLVVGGAVQHHNLIKDVDGRVRDSGTTTATYSNGDDGSRSQNSDDATISSNPKNDSLEQNVSTPSDALHLERRVIISSFLSTILFN